jgi:hypothetical protein
MDIMELSVELNKAKTLAVCIENTLTSATVGAVGENIEQVFCLVALLEDHLDTLENKVDRLKGDVDEQQ